jgi:hypothetical protein
MNAIKSIVAEYQKPRDPYQCGYDAGRNGPNTDNCHFAIFSTPSRMKEWERGKRDGEMDAKRKDGGR